jgi:hypothetical protein
MLDTLANYQAELDALALQKADLIATVLTPEIKQKLADIEAEFSGKAQTAQLNAAELKAQIEAAVKAQGTTVKGEFLQAVFMKGRESWDGKLLSGFAIAHPEILTARKVGEPSVSFRGVK